MSAEPPREKATFGWPFSLVLNRLLENEPWAAQRLAPFAGQCVELRGPPLPAVRFTILPGGRVQPGGGDPALVITLRPEALVALARGEEHLLRSVLVEGDARLADEVMLLVRHLRWDVEEDLSRLVGDVAARRLAGLVRGFAAWQAEAAQRLAGAGAGYAADEARLLVRRAELEVLAAEVGRLRDALERLDKRIERLG